MPWDHDYQVYNNSGQCQPCIKVILAGTEVVVASYASPSGWAPPGRTPIPPNTRFTFGSSANPSCLPPCVPAGGMAEIAWQTPDNTSRVLDLRWCSGAVANPSGGYLSASFELGVPESDLTTFVLMNLSLSSEEPLDLSPIQWAQSRRALPPERLPLLLPERRGARHRDEGLEWGPLERLPGLDRPIEVAVLKGFDPEAFRPWRVPKLDLGEYTAFVVKGLTPGAGFLMRGALVERGEIRVSWVYQATL